MDTSTADGLATVRAHLGELRTAQVAVLQGGRSSERAISLRSGAGVLAALGTGADGLGPARVRPVELLSDGRWQLDGDRLSAGEALARLADIDVFFLALHGGEGEGGTIQGLLEAHDRAYTGAGVTASALCLDKVYSRDLLSQSGLRVAPARLVSAREWRTDARRVQRDVAALGARLCIKPRSGGSSVGATVLPTSELERGLVESFAWEEEALVEAFVEGLETTVGVIEDAEGRAHALPAVEIHPRAGHFFDYEEKYDADGAEEVCPPRTLAPATCARLAHDALLAHRRLSCQGYSRTDFIVPAAGAPVLLETNTLPGLTERSLLPLAAKAAGLDFRGLCLALAVAGQARFRRRRVRR